MDIRSVESRVVNKHWEVATTLCLLVLLVSTDVFAYTANLTATPNPSSGNYSLTWNIHTTQGVYWLQQRPTGGSTWTTILNTTYTTTSYSVISQPIGSYEYRLRHNHQDCPGIPGMSMGGCGPSTVDFSEIITVTVQSASPPTTPTISYEYDALGRLTVVTYPEDKIVTYEYDSAGNRIDREVSQ